MMHVNRITPLRYLLCLLGLMLAASPLPAQNLLVNGDFETGDFTGWTRVNRPLGDPYDPLLPPNRRVRH